MFKQLFSIGMLMLLTSIAVSADKFIAANDSNLTYSDYAMLEFITRAGRPVARLFRPLASARKGYNWDNPGARLRFTTDAENITVELIYNDKHISTSARNPVGFYLIDGKSSSQWRFQSRTRKTVRGVEQLSLKMPRPTNGAYHTYEIIMPYGDAIDVMGVRVNQTAKFIKPQPRPSVRCAIYGDSITQGFTATTIVKTYAFRLVQSKNWQLINLGIGGRGSSSSPGDGTIIGKINYELLIVLMGVNDWQGGRPPAQYKKNMTKFIINFREQQPDTPIYFITPLWVPDSWQPKRAKFELEIYRQALREVVKNSNDANITLIEGSKLIDHDKRYFDRVAVHPNDAGFKMMAERLTEKIKL